MIETKLEIPGIGVEALFFRPDDIADTDGYLARAYGTTDRTLVLIRPDGYIGLI